MFHCKEETCAKLQESEVQILLLRDELQCANMLIYKLQCELESTRADLVQANEMIEQLKQQLESRDEELCNLEDNLRFTEQELQEIRSK